MLIGMCGRLASGKDTVAAYLVQEYGFRRFAFADQLKALAYDLGWDGQKDEVGRKLLQELGVGARNRIAPDVWVQALQNNIVGAGLRVPEDDIVVSDVRFDNEVAWLCRNGGVLVRVVRPSIDRNGPAHQHVSETQQDAFDVDLDLINDDTIEVLHRKVSSVLVPHLGEWPLAA